VTELGIKDLMLPIGMRAPVSEKIKQRFRFGSRKDAEVMKEPEFEKVDSYFLVSVSLQSRKTLVIELAREPTAPPYSDSFKITYDVESLGQQNADGPSLPRIEYTSRIDGSLVTEPDLLQISEIKAASDLSKMRLLGSAVLAKAEILQDFQLIASRGKLEELRIGSDDLVIPSAIKSGRYDSLFKFLSSIAESYAPFVRNMQDKTPIKGELTLKEELGGGQRKEYSVRAEELKSQLKDTEHGNSIAQALGL
jgi:hypothetical protein